MKLLLQPGNRELNPLIDEGKGIAFYHAASGNPALVPRPGRSEADIYKALRLAVSTGGHREALDKLFRWIRDQNRTVRKSNPFTIPASYLVRLAMNRPNVASFLNFLIPLLYKHCNDSQLYALQVDPVISIGARMALEKYHKDFTQVNEQKISSYYNSRIEYHQGSVLIVWQDFVTIDILYGLTSHVIDCVYMFGIANSQFPLYLVCMHVDCIVFLLFLPWARLMSTMSRD